MVNRIIITLGIAYTIGSSSLFSSSANGGAGAFPAIRSAAGAPLPSVTSPSSITRSPSSSVLSPSSIATSPSPLKTPRPLGRKPAQPLAPLPQQDPARASSSSSASHTAASSISASQPTPQVSPAPRNLLHQPLPPTVQLRPIPVAAPVAAGGATASPERPVATLSHAANTSPFKVPNATPPKTVAADAPSAPLTETTRKLQTRLTFREPSAPLKLVPPLSGGSGAGSATTAAITPSPIPLCGGSGGGSVPAAASAAASGAGSSSTSTMPGIKEVTNILTLIQRGTTAEQVLSALRDLEAIEPSDYIRIFQAIMKKKAIALLTAEVISEITKHNDSLFFIVIHIAAQGSQLDILTLALKKATADQITQLLEYPCSSALCTPLQGCKQSLHTVIEKQKENLHLLNALVDGLSLIVADDRIMNLTRDLKTLIGRLSPSKK